MAVNTHGFALIPFVAEPGLQCIGLRDYPQSIKQGQASVLFRSCRFVATWSNKALPELSRLRGVASAIEKLDGDKNRPDAILIKSRTRAAVDRTIKLCEIYGTAVPDDLTRLQASLSA